ncbi:SMC-Scp complex subunit ScpB [Sporolactobacillus terrae]|uniref:Segregation and condensation protein B n=1 Tax=Sporolactobacillus terrae TaxID=269673 RepID=A0A5K7WWN6_9BACL|nr:SMC-Scp complex subunit ScpB [Sporolactobacillus terrae]UAK17431.1 SMC-Scp complex subunit ScpB [Sporolactobacillus terrae]BBN98975.1 segregation and condensation protein B [Sporolactobacillus terrae]
MILKREKIHSIIEGLLYITGEDGVQVEQIHRVLPECTRDEISDIVERMKENYQTNESSGLMITDLPNGYRLTTKPFMKDYAKQFAAIPKTAPLSQAALETVAIIAYKQPVSRIDIEEIRGVKSERALQTLVVKGLIKEVGRAEGSGRAILYGVTPLFLDYFGLHDLSELPPLAEMMKQQNEQVDTYDLFYDQYKETVKDL